MTPIKHYYVAKQVEDRLRQVWAYKPLLIGKNGQPKNAASPHQKYGPLERCVQVVAQQDRIEVRIIHAKRNDVCRILTASLRQYWDGVPVDIIDPDPTDEKRWQQLHIGETRG